MNIFCLDHNPEIAAKWACDKHVVKMPLESCQLLANCFPKEDLEKAPLTKSGTPWKHSHYNHPCAKWVRETKSNAEWLLEHTKHLFQEKYRRYPKNGRHFSHDFFDWIQENIASTSTPDGPLINFAVAINQDMLCRKDPRFDLEDEVGKYRLYYIHDKPFATWKMNKPDWI